MAVALISFVSTFRSPRNTKKHFNFSAVKPSILVRAQASQPAGSIPTTAANPKTTRIKHPKNVDGDFFVDSSCVDCHTCYWMAPETFKRVDGKAAAFQQPTCDEERKKALQALISCPTSSIRTETPPHDILEVHKTLPCPIDETLEGIYHCGHHSAKAYGAASYLITRPEGNILIDSPQFTKRLYNNIKNMGGARYIFLTHKDDVADHAKWSKALGCPRILHVDEINSDTADVEIKLEGTGPWTLLGSDITLIHTPGHTEGSICLFYESKKVLFSGDHLANDSLANGEIGLSIHDDFNWQSIPLQLKSVQKLLDLDFEWLLPGHRRRVRFKDFEDKNVVLKAFLTARGVQVE